MVKPRSRLWIKGSWAVFFAGMVAVDTVPRCAIWLKVKLRQASGAHGLMFEYGRGVRRLEFKLPAEAAVVW
jgi:hypothetical protein